MWPSSAMVWMTPIARPMNDTGTHTAEHESPPRLRRCGHASSAELDGNVTAAPLRTATQEYGDATGQPGPSGVEPATTACSRFALLLSASEQLGRAAVEKIVERAAHHLERGRLVVGHLERAVDAALRLLAVMVGQQHRFTGLQLGEHAVERTRQATGLVVAVHVGLGVEVALGRTFRRQLHALQRITDETGDQPTGAHITNRAIDAEHDAEVARASRDVLLNCAIASPRSSSARSATVCASAAMNPKSRLSAPSVRLRAR